MYTTNLKSLYIFASAIFRLDYYILNSWSKNDMFGQYTLSNYYRYINKFFGTDYIIPQHHLPFFRFENGSSNIYTALTLPIQDYGVIGMLFTRALMTFIYTRLRKNVLSESNINNIVVPTTITGYLLYVFFPILLLIV